MGKKKKSDSERLVLLGKKMDEDREFALSAVEKMVKVRNRKGRMVPLCANAAQRLYEERRGKQNIVLKARQMGMTTWIASRFFLRTITRPGTLTLQVAHTRAAAEAIFRMDTACGRTCLKGFAKVHWRAAGRT